MATPIKPQDLVIHVMNVGFGDNIIIQFPQENGQRQYAVVDCVNSAKTIEYLKKLEPNEEKGPKLAFVCATHPHKDHISGINALLKNSDHLPGEFWDSGFRHNTNIYKEILETISDSDIQMIRVSSGMEQYFGKVRVSVLSPSVALRNRYNTYGVDMNNASIVLRLEHYDQDVLLARSQEYTEKNTSEIERTAGKSVVILAGDAEFDSWAQITQEYPQVERTSKYNPLVKKMVNYLSCAVIKVAHHGSMHSAPLDVYEKMEPELALVSTEQQLSSKKCSSGIITRELFPHRSTTIALEECGAKLLTTDGCYESQIVNGGEKRDPDMAHAGTIVVVVPPGKKPRFTKLDDDVDDVPDPPSKV